MTDSSLQPEPRPGCLWPGLAALLLTIGAIAPPAHWSVAVLTVGALALLVASLPLSLALADHGLRLALRAAEYTRLRPRYGDAAARIALWTDLAGPLTLSWLNLTAIWALARAWPGKPWLALLAIVGRLVVEVALQRSGREATVRPLNAALGLCRPFLRPLLALVRGSAAAAEPETTANQALAEAIEVGDQEGELSVSEANLLRRELGFGHTPAAEVMVPWARVAWLSAGAELPETRRRLASSSHSRQPVCDAAGRVVDIIHARDLLTAVDGSRSGEPPPQRTVVRVSPDAGLDEVLGALRAQRVSMAVVEAPDGSPVGLITIEDLVEELVGQIADESDAGVVRESLLVDGRRSLEELEAEGIDLPGVDRSQTLAEFLAAALPPPIQPGAAWRRGVLTVTVVALDADGTVDEAHATWRLSGQENGA